jgi:guanylate kinase
MSEIFYGNCFIVAAPSGGGKTSLVRQLVETLDNIEISISHTTRPMRTGEEDGIDYFFLDDVAFQDKINQGDFVEYAQVFNHFYGTSKAQLLDRMQQGMDILLDIDWQGAAQIRHSFPDSVSIFIIPPSLGALKERLLKRRRDNDEVIKERMRKAEDELSHYPEFDYLIVNDDFDKAAMELRAIVVADRLCIERQVKKQEKLLSFLMPSQ